MWREVSRVFLQRRNRLPGRGFTSLVRVSGYGPKPDSPPPRRALVVRVARTSSSKRFRTQAWAYDYDWRIIWPDGERASGRLVEGARQVMRPPSAPRDQVGGGHRR